MECAPSPTCRRRSAARAFARGSGCSGRSCQRAGDRVEAGRIVDLKLGVGFPTREDRQARFALDAKLLDQISLVTFAGAAHVRACHGVLAPDNDLYPHVTHTVGIAARRDTDDRGLRRALAGRDEWVSPA